MSTVIVITPLIIASWAAIAAAVTAAVGAMGFAAARSSDLRSQGHSQETARAEIEVEDSEILADASGSGEQMVVEREGLRATFSRDGRGTLRVCMEGKGHSKAELKRIGEELVGRVTQQYVYNRVITGLKERGMAVVDEQVAADRTVKIRVRNW